MSEKIKVSQLRESTNGTDSDLVMIVQENEENELENFKQTKQEFLSDTRALIDNKQNKEMGKGLSTNDFTTPLKAKLEGIEAGAEANTINEIDINGIAQVPVNKKIDISVPEKTSDLENDSEFVSRNTTGLLNYTLTTQTGSKIDLEINTSTYVLTAKLYDKNNNLISTSTGIDLPLETMIVGGSYDSQTKEIVLTLKNGDTVRFSVADLVSGLQTEITSSNKLSADLVDDSTTTNKFVTAEDKTNWNAKVDEEDIADFVKNTDYATGSKGGVIKTSNGLKVTNNGQTVAENFTYQKYLSEVYNDYFIGKGTLENVITGKELINQTQLEESQQPQDESIAEMQEILSNIPPKTGTGEEFTIDNTMKCKHVSDKLGGNTSQETTTGKNLLPRLTQGTSVFNGKTYTVDENGILEMGGTPTSAGAKTIQLEYPYSITNETRYLYLFNNYSDATFGVRLMNGSSRILEIVPSTENIKVELSQYSGQTITAIQIFQNTSFTNTRKISPMISASDTETTFEKYTGRNTFT